MKKTPTDELLSLPRRKSNQTLQGFVFQHLKDLERARSYGIRYEGLSKALRVSGFDDRTTMSLRVAVCRARKRAIECTSTQPVQTLVSLMPQTPRPMEESSRSPPKDERAAIARRLRELARPPRSGEDDPLD